MSIDPDRAAQAMENQTDIDNNPNSQIGESDNIGPAEGGLSDETPTLEEGNTGFLGSITDRLFATEPNKDLQSVESPWDPQNGGASRIYRGIQKMGDIEGMPAIADLVIGAIELTQDDSIELPQTDNSSNQTEVDEI